MMPLELYLAFIAATVILMVIPGPNVALIVANSVAHGTRFGLLTVAGDQQRRGGPSRRSPCWARPRCSVSWRRASTGCAGSASPISSGWASRPGARRSTDLAQTTAQARSARLIFARGFLVGLTNPKTLLFYGAFFPQFITPGPTAADQLLLLAVTFLVVAIVLDSAWAILAGRLRALLVAHARLRNRLTGGLLVGAGVGLALARRP